MNIRLVYLLLIIVIAGCFFYKACYNVNFKCEKLFHRKSNNLKQRECIQGQVGDVEFALHPQYETSLDSGIQTIKDFNYFNTFDCDVIPEFSCSLKPDYFSKLVDFKTSVRINSD